ncbi:MAG: roadblock/LC7 domain-containing protein [Nitrospirae bacterium]|nr:roadblock/LC7 domain-containing protein [Nitrospirota bacterium]MBI5696195.1 roadblock/LC7 domain-containing protein [Nitrospirota bacterium]
MFKKILQETVEGLPGAVGAIFADWEGEAVEQFFPGPVDDIKLLGAHQGIILHLIAEAGGESGLGAAEVVLITLADAKVVVQPLKDGYFLVLLAERTCNGGLALRATGRAAEILREEI